MFFGLKFSELNLALRHKQKIFLRGVLCNSCGQIELNIEKLKKLKKLEFWTIGSLSSFLMFGSTWDEKDNFS